MCAAQLDEWTVSVFSCICIKHSPPGVKLVLRDVKAGCLAGAGLSPSSRPVHRSRQQPSPSGVSPLHLEFLRCAPAGPPPSSHLNLLNAAPPLAQYQRLHPLNMGKQKRQKGEKMKKWGAKRFCCNLVPSKGTDKAPLKACAPVSGTDAGLPRYAGARKSTVRLCLCNSCSLSPVRPSLRVCLSNVPGCPKHVGTRSWLYSNPPELWEM